MKVQLKLGRGGIRRRRSLDRERLEHDSAEPRRQRPRCRCPRGGRSIASSATLTCRRRRGPHGLLEGRPSPALTSSVARDRHRRGDDARGARARLRALSSGPSRSATAPASGSPGVRRFVAESGGCVSRPWRARGHGTTVSMYFPVVARPAGGGRLRATRTPREPRRCSSSTTTTACAAAFAPSCRAGDTRSSRRRTRSVPSRSSRIPGPPSISRSSTSCCKRRAAWSSRDACRPFARPAPLLPNLRPHRAAPRALRMGGSRRFPAPQGLHAGGALCRA